MTPCLFNRNQGLPRSGRTVYDGTSLLREKIQDSALLAQHSVKHRVFQINIKSGRRKYVELRTQHFVDKFAKFTIRKFRVHSGWNVQGKQALHIRQRIRKCFLSQRNGRIRFRRQSNLFYPFIGKRRKPYRMQKFDLFRQISETAVPDQFHEFPFICGSLFKRSSRTHRLSISVHPASVPVGNRSGLGLQAQNSHFTVKNDKIRFAFMNHA